MSFVNQYSHNISFCKEFIEGGESYIYSLSMYSFRIQDRFYITKNDVSGRTIWSKEIKHSRLSMGELELQMVQIGGIPAKSDIHASIVKKETILQSDVKGLNVGFIQNDFYGQYIILAKSTSNPTINLLSIDKDGNINWTRAYDFLEKGHHRMKMVSNDYSFYLLSSENDETYHTLSRFDSAGQRLKTVNLKGVIFARDLLLLREALIICGNYERQGKILYLDFELNIQASHIIESREVIRDIWKIDANDQVQLLMKAELEDGRFGIGIWINHLKSDSFNFIIVNDNFPEFSLSPENFYFIRESTIHCVNFSLDHLWVKEFKVGYGAILDNGSISYNYQSGNLTGSFSEHGIADGSSALLLYMNNQAETCITENAKIEEFIRSTGYIYHIDSERPQEIKLGENRISYESHENQISVTDLCGGQAIDENAEIQSSCIYLQAAGSTGGDSSAGIHLRWMLKGPILEHLPKGDFFHGTPQGFNKPDDFVHILRAEYTPVTTRLNLSEKPDAIVNHMGIWLYQRNGKKFHVYFRNTTKYHQVRSSINPLTNPPGFLQLYGDSILEIEIKDDLFFGVQLYSANLNGSFKAEVLSVESNKLNIPKSTAFRKRIQPANSAPKIFAENGRSLRIAAFDCTLNAVDFEFYSDFIHYANKNSGWLEIGKFSLSTNDAQVYQQLDPDPINHPIHAVWPRYNDGEFVNIRNYREKWNGDVNDRRNLIKNSVEKYLELSNNPANPLANETYFLENDEDEIIDPENSFEVSHLTILQMASLDYHVARMLGLGLLDFSDEIYSNKRYIYAAQYATEADLHDGNGNQQKNHVSLSLPTSLNDQRFSLPVELKEPVPGIISADPSSNTQTLTDAAGYTFDGTARYLSLFAKELSPDEPQNIPFYFSSHEFNMSEFTFPVYVGIEYKKEGDPIWVKPELPNDRNYQNVNAAGNPSANETVPIGIPEIGNPVFVHRETKSGKHIYGSYGVNWFSRARSTYQTWMVESDIKPANQLLPPSNINATLIQKENPLLFTSQNEQGMLEAITDADKTLARLTFEYDAAQDMVTYHKAINGEEIPEFADAVNIPPVFADEAELFFRPEVPKQFFGMVKSVEDLSGNPVVSVVHTKALILYSTNTGSGSTQELTPNIPPSEYQNFLGGIFTVGSDEFVIQNIFQGNDPQFPIFHLQKKPIGNAFGQGVGIPFDPANFVSPAVDQSFMVVENMQNTATWGNMNPHSLKVQIGLQAWGIHSEEITTIAGQAPDMTLNTYFRKFRGIYKGATIKQYIDPNAVFSGVYEITFDGFILNNHPQFGVNNQPNVQWYQGSVRIARVNKPDEERKTLKVLRIENINSGNLVIYAVDETYLTDPIYPFTEPTQEWSTEVNFYPGYRVYLYKNVPYRLTKDHVYSQIEDVLEKYSIFGLRSINISGSEYKSRMSLPAMMFSRRIDPPAIPQQPTGALYATRPDYFGRATYAFTTEYAHKPFSVTFLRSNDDILLSSLYKQTPYGESPIENSVQDIRIKNGDQFSNDRLLDLANATIDLGTSLFKEYNGYRLPLPNNPQFVANINNFIDEHNSYYNTSLPHITLTTIQNMDSVVIPADSQLRYGELKFYDFVKQTIQNTYVPLTEIPIIYQYIKGGTYRPIPKAQVIRDKNGTLLNPSSADFDMAPMAKILSINPHKTLFVDFTLDGNSTGVYFYAVKETNSQMEHSLLSAAVGPVKLISSYPLKTPEIKSVIPILQNEVLGINPGIEIQINSYDAIYRVRKVKLYRALNLADATSVRSMALIKEVDLEQEGMMGESTCSVRDDFENLQEVPFSDPLYYRVTVEAEIEYAEANYDGQQPVIVKDYAPSEASKLLITTITENVLPNSPSLTYTALPGSSQSTLSDVKFYWDKQVYKATYHLYKMTNQGNWTKIKSIQSNEELVTIKLSDTEWGSGNLIVQDSDNNPVYHHFKVVTENTAGMMSTEEKILTIGTELLYLVENDPNLLRYRHYFGTSDLIKENNLIRPPFNFYDPSGGHGNNSMINDNEAVGFWKQMQEYYLALPEINTDLKKNPHVYNLRTKQFGCYYSYTRMWDGSIPGSSHHFLKNSLKKARKTGARECIVNLGNDHVFVTKNIEVLKHALLSGNDKGIKTIGLVVNNTLTLYTRQEIIGL